MFSFQSQVKEFQVHFQLMNLSRGYQSVSDYFGKVCQLADSLASSGTPLSEKEMITYLLNGLGSYYESYVTSITMRGDPISFYELYQLLLIHETCISHNNDSSLTSIESSTHFSSVSHDQRGCSSFWGGH